MGSIVATFVMILGLITPASANAAKLSGTVKIDGSSTVFPVTEAVAEEFRTVAPRVRVTVGVSGTGGGFKKFTKGETDINDASRPIKDKEMVLSQKNKIEYLEIAVAYDGISVVVNKANTFVDYLTPQELNKIWKSGSKVKMWKDIRASWPAEEIKLFGPGTDSGTFDYFSEAINGKSGNSRSDYSMSEDDNMLVQGVSGNKFALGYFGYAYYKENKNKLKAIPIKTGSAKPVLPSEKNINNGIYTPLSRPIFIYVNKASLRKPEVMRFVEFYIEKAASLVSEVGYVPLPKEKYLASHKELLKVK